MSSSVFYGEFGDTRTLPGPLYRLNTVLCIMWQRAQATVTNFFFDRNRSVIDLDFVADIRGEFHHKIKTPYGTRKVHQSGPIVLYLNDVFHGTDLPLANRANMRVTGFSCQRELLISELDRDGNTISIRLLSVRKGKIVAKTERGNLDKWAVWN